VVLEAMKPTIELPCGCVISDVYVHVMCIPHFHALTEKKAQIEKNAAENQRVLRGWLEESIRQLHSSQKQKT